MQTRTLNPEDEELFYQNMNGSDFMRKRRITRLRERERELEMAIYGKENLLL